MSDQVQLRRPDVIRHTCPVHGVQEFIHMAAFDWWKCPEYHGDHSDCRSVVLAEDLTPDGVDVVQWDRDAGSFEGLVRRHQQLHPDGQHS